MVKSISISTIMKMIGSGFLKILDYRLWTEFDRTYSRLGGGFSIAVEDGLS